MSESPPPNGTVLRGRDVLDLYIHRSLMAERSLATERDIVIKNYAAFGAVMLFQASFLAKSFPKPLVIIACGVIIVAISTAARAMSIFYIRYSKVLYESARAAKKAALRGRDSFYVQRKEQEFDLKKLNKESNQLSWRDFFTDTTALGIINILPGFVGLFLVLAGLVMAME